MATVDVGIRKYDFQIPPISTACSRCNAGTSLRRTRTHPLRTGTSQSSSNSMLIPRERISFTNTLKDSGIPATIR